MKKCPSCKYERTTQDDFHFPEYECPSCGVINNMYKARYEFAEFEKRRKKERKAKLEKIKKEQELKRKQEEEDHRKKEEEQRLRKETEEKLRQEQERLQMEAEEKIRLEQERLRKEAEKKVQLEQERLRKEAEEKVQLEQERLRKEAEEKVRLEQEHLRKEAEKKLQFEEQRLKRESEEKLRQEHEERKRKEKEAADQFAKKQQRIKKQAEASKDRIISLQETLDKYQLFDMCPFVIAQTGMGLPIIGLGETKNKWQHGRCMKEYCRLWTWKIDNKGQSYAQGCSLQFLGLSEGEITKNFSVKNRQILEEKASPAKDETSSENKDIET